MDAEQINICKENIQPLRQGRACSQLNEALQAQASINLELQQVIQNKIQEYELALRTYKGDDPLSPWFEYINWVEQYFPKHGKEGNFCKLLQKCLALYKDSDKYKQDPRYIQLWIKYLEMLPDSPCEMYEMVYNHGIGLQVAALYHNWAMELAKQGNMKRADEVYRKGIAAQAQPVEDLEQKHKNFQFMVVRNKMEGGDSEPETQHRPALGRLETVGPHNAVPHERGQPLHPVNSQHQQTEQQQPLAAKTPTKFTLFKDENLTLDEFHALPVQQPLKSFPTHKSMRAENTVEPTQWTQCASHKPPPSTATLTTPFKVHEDPVIPDVCNSSARRHSTLTSALHERKVREQPEWSVPLAIFEPADAKLKPMYCKDKVYAGGTEFSFEELRAHCFRKRHRDSDESDQRAKVTKYEAEAPSVEAAASAQEQKSSEPAQELFKPNEKIMFSKIFLQESEVCFEEHRAQTYLRRRKEYEDRKALEAASGVTSRNSLKQPAAVAESAAKPDTSNQGSYEVSDKERLCVTYATLENGVEYSFEELRARLYLDRRQRFNSLMTTVQDLHREPAAAAIEPQDMRQLPSWPVAIFDPPKPNQKLMYPKNKVYGIQDTEFSLEELKAMQYAITHQLHPAESLAERDVSGTNTPSATSSRGTTPSGTPGRMGLLSMLGQSMTVNTKEAMAAMKDIWGPSYESPFPPPPPSPPKVAPFSIFCDTKPASAPFPIFSSSASAPVPEEPAQQVKRGLGVKRVLQVVSEPVVTRPEDVGESQSVPWSSLPEQTQVDAVGEQQTTAQFNVFQDQTTENMETSRKSMGAIKKQQNEGRVAQFNIFQDQTENMETSRKSVGAITQGERSAQPMRKKGISMVGGFQIYQEPKQEIEEPCQYIKQEEVAAVEQNECDVKPTRSLNGFDVYKEPQDNGIASKLRSTVQTDGSTSYVTRQSISVQESWNTYSNPVKQEQIDVYESQVMSSNEQWTKYQQLQDVAAALPEPTFPVKYEIPYVPPPPDDDDNEQDVPNKENVSPSNYQVPSEPRRVAGILTESKDIPFIPLEQQQEEEEEKDEVPDETELGVRPIPAFVEDVTALTTVFKQTLFSSSTPYQHESQSLLGRLTEQETDERGSGSPVVPVVRSIKDEICQEDEEAENVAPVIQASWDARDLGMTAPRQTILSPILEMTGESRGSRSGSSSGSSCASSRLHAISTSHAFSKTPGQFSATCDSRLASVLASIERPTRLQFVETEDEEVEPQSNNAPSLEAKDLNSEELYLTNMREIIPEPEDLTIHMTMLKEKAPSEEHVDDVAAVTQQVSALSLTDVDPFSDDLQKYLLTTLRKPLPARPGFMKYNVPLPEPRVSQNMPLGSTVAKLRRSLGEGAYAKVYRGQVGGHQRVLKLALNDTNCWDFYISTEIQYRLQQKSLAHQFCIVSNTYLHKNGSIYEMDFLSNVTLLDVVNFYKQNNETMPLGLVIYLSYQVLLVMQSLHSCHIIHADIKPDNFLLLPSNNQFSADLQLIDFGRSIDMDLFSEGTTFNTVFKIADFRCVEMRTDKPWTYQLDLYSAAATIHVLLFGRYMNIKETRGRWMPTCKPKRFWELCDLFLELFELLLNVPSCNELPDLSPIIDKLYASACNNSIVVVRELTKVLAQLKE